MLSSTDIKKDIREIERCSHSESDSDSSVLSEDVLPSTYPVKPRKNPKWIQPRVTGAQDDDEIIFDKKTAEEALAFLKVVKSSKRDLYERERERELLEIQNEVIFSSLFAPPLVLIVHSSLTKILSPPMRRSSPTKKNSKKIILE